MDTSDDEKWEDFFGELHRHYFSLNNQSNPHFTYLLFLWKYKKEEKSYQTFFYYDAYYIQHLQFHVLQFPFKIVVMMTQLVLSIPSLLLFFFYCTFSHILFLILTLPLWIERLPFFEIKILHILCDGSSGWEIWLFAFCSVYLDSFFCFKFFFFCYMLWMLMFRQHKMCWFCRLPNSAVC